MFINNQPAHCQILPYESKVTQQRKLAYVGIFVSQGNVNAALDIIKNVLDKNTWAYIDCVYQIVPRREEILAALREESILIVDPENLPTASKFKEKVKKGYAGILINTMYNSDFISYAGMNSIIPAISSHPRFSVFCADYHASNNVHALAYLGYSQFHYILTHEEKEEILNELEMLIENRFDMSNRYRVMSTPESLRDNWNTLRNYMLSDELTLFNS